MNERTLAFLVGSALAGVACGSSPAVSDAGGDATTDVNLTDASGATDAAPDASDASVDAFWPSQPDAALGDGGAPFACGSTQCTCDGTTSFCEQLSAGGVASSDGGGDANDCSSGVCPAFPSACAQDHSCQCLLAQYGASCVCGLDPTGNGLVLSCVAP